jgi:hypothetical protein
MDAQWQTTLGEQGARFQDDRVEDFGDPGGELQAVAAGETVLADLSHRALLTATGSEVLSFLQGQLTNDVYPAEHGSPILGAHLSPKGRVLAGLLLFAFEDGYALDFPADMLESLAKRLRMFVLRADVTLTEAHSQWARFGVTGPGAEAAAAAAAGAQQLVPEGVTRGDHGTVVPLPGPHPAFMVLVPYEAAPAAWERTAVSARAVGLPAWELARIRAGVPDLGAPASERFIPQEANLEDLGGISYTKGCYTGQEVVARTKHLGRLKRRLFRIQSPGPLAPSQALYAGGDQSQGRVVNAAPRPDGGWEALAVVRIEAAEGTAPLAPEGEPEAALTLLDLPYSVAGDAG